MRIEFDFGISSSFIDPFDFLMESIYIENFEGIKIALSVVDQKEIGTDIEYILGEVDCVDRVEIRDYIYRKLSELGYEREIYRYMYQMKH